ncbi:GNAT family N-acetyltransferase [Actinotalea sp. K2]|uniref:GNAT family N-acetyltransferase n=1 Tax=Actinotalea sp. K2 TaxID=2939438 RepID=UPI002017658C|nr:GNAT family N-acetyltransferase [Actinotalea sp. K2]MCL3860191.1 GNAT family N-acetyltransferase [Actinotalea sp. K2]
MALFREQADVSVRPAQPDDEAAIARVQLRAWRSSHAALLGPEVLEQIDVTAVRDQWSRAITAPPSPAHHVLVACDGARVIGFAASAPVEDGVEILALEVDPDHQRGGHGSRLLTACVDLGRDQGAQHLQTWVLDDDDARAQFLSSAGLGPDGAHRDLATGTTAEGATRAVSERRWVAEL